MQKCKPLQKMDDIPMVNRERECMNEYEQMDEKEHAKKKTGRKKRMSIRKSSGVIT